MSQIAAKPQPIPHLVPTVLVGVVCLFSLSAAGVGLYASHSARAEICHLVAQQLWGLHSTVRNDRQLIPGQIKSNAMAALVSSKDFLALHCPADAIKPPKPENPGDPHIILRQLLGSIAD